MASDKGKLPHVVVDFVTSAHKFSALIEENFAFCWQSVNWHRINTILTTYYVSVSIIRKKCW
jgi:hypothetical protein